MDVSADELPNLYSWVDGIPLSRPKRNIARDFSDGVLAAEVVAHYCPKLVDLHNYVPASGLTQKISNWTTLNNKVFKRLCFTLTKEDIEAVSNAEPQMIERILKLLKYKIAKYKPNASKGQTAINEEGATPKGRFQGAAPWSQGRLECSPLQYRCGANSIPPQNTEQFQDGSHNSVSPQFKSSQVPVANGVHNDFSEKLALKDSQIRELLETVELLEAKVMKLEQLVRLKDHKIQFISEKVVKPAHS